LRYPHLIGFFLCLSAVPPAIAGGVPRIHASSYEDAACPNGVREESEQCDDGDGDELDGCTSQCRKSVTCDAAAFPGGDRFAVDAAVGRCYVLHESEALTYNQATSVCSTQGGHLASLTSAAEAALLQPLQAGQRPWIGATDLPEAGNFSWLTGESFGYQAFAAGQPDGDGNCLVLDGATGLWSDSACDLTTFAVGFICEFEP
jgi:cysteine-rich repeat protein